MLDRVGQRLAGHEVGGGLGRGRERDGDGVTVHLVLLDAAQQPLPAGPGSVTAVTFAARDLAPDLRAAFDGRQAVILH